MKKFLEIVRAVFLSLVDGKKVVIELNEAPVQTVEPKKETDTFSPLLQPSHT